MGCRCPQFMAQTAAAAAAAACMLTATSSATAADMISKPQSCHDVAPQVLQQAEQRSRPAEQQSARSSRELATPNPVAQLAGLFGIGDELDEPVDPFTLYGTAFKRFFIDKMDGEKIVSRRRGFTVEACTAVIAASQESPSFQGLSAGQRVNAIAAGRTCREATDLELKPACAVSCRDACRDGLAAYTRESSAETGFKVSAKAQERVMRGCTRQCAYECAKPGKAYDFVVPYRQ